LSLHNAFATVQNTGHVVDNNTHGNTMPNGDYTIYV